MTDYSSLLDRCERKLQEIKARCARDGSPAWISSRPADEPPMRLVICTDLPALVGWALEKVEHWKVDLSAEFAGPGTKLVAQAELKSLARALGIHGERG